MHPGAVTVTVQEMPKKIVFLLDKRVRVGIKVVDRKRFHSFKLVNVFMTHGLAALGPRKGCRTPT